jgi:hypothetical protein
MTNWDMKTTRGSGCTAKKILLLQIEMAVDVVLMTRQKTMCQRQQPDAEANLFDLRRDPTTRR